MRTLYLPIATVLITACVGMVTIAPVIASQQRINALDLQPIPVQFSLRPGWSTGSLQRCSMTERRTAQEALDPITGGSTLFIDAALQDLTSSRLVPADQITQYMPPGGPAAGFRC